MVSVAAGYIVALLVIYCIDVYEVLAQHHRGFSVATRWVWCLNIACNVLITRHIRRAASAFDLTFCLGYRLEPYDVIAVSTPSHAGELLAYKNQLLNDRCATHEGNALTQTAPTVKNMGARPNPHVSTNRWRESRGISTFLRPRLTPQPALSSPRPFQWGVYLRIGSPLSLDGEMVSFHVILQMSNLVFPILDQGASITQECPQGQRTVASSFLLTFVTQCLHVGNRPSLLLQPHN